MKIDKKSSIQKPKAIVAATILMLSILAIAPTATAQIAPPTITKTATPTNINIAGSGVDEETTITLTVTGSGSTTTTTVPMDVVFALDSSGSMSWNDPSGLRKTAAKSFVDKMNSTKDQAGVVSWDDGIDFTQALTNDFSLVKTKIDAVDSSGGTNLNVGLTSAAGILDTGKQNGASWVIVFLSNGQGTYSHSTAVAIAAKGYTVYTIGLAISAGSTAENNLKDIASTTGGKYYSSPSASNLDAIFKDIYTEVTTSTIPHYVDVVEVTQSYIIDEGSFNIVPDSVTTVGGITTIIWNNIGMGDGDPDLSADETVTLTFKAKSSNNGANMDVDVFGTAKVNYDDKDGNYAGSVNIPQAKINVNAPPVANADGPYVNNEGSSITFDASGSTDPDGDALQYRWDFDSDGTWDTPWLNVPTASYTWNDDFSGTATLEVSDGTLTDTDTAIVTVNNVAPVVDAGLDATIDEGGTFSSSGSFTDPGSDTWTATVDYGDGSGVQTLALADKTFALSHMYADNGVYTATVTVTDDDGGTGSDTAVVTVNNVAPTVTLDASYYVTIPITLRIAGQGKVGNSVELQVIQDGNVLASDKIIRTPGSPNEQEVTISATIDLSKSYSGKLIFDTETAYSGGTPVWVIIDGVKTKVTTFNTQKSDPLSYHQTYDFALSGLVSVIGKEISFTGSATDPGEDDLTFDWLFGDGGSASKLYPWPNSHSVTETVKHTYSAAGSYTVNLDVTDDDGGKGSASKTIVIS